LAQPTEESGPGMHPFGWTVGCCNWTGLRDPLAKKFLDSCKHISQNSKPTSRKQLSGDLLDINGTVQHVAQLQALKNGAAMGSVEFC